MTMMICENRSETELLLASRRHVGQTREKGLRNPLSDDQDEVPTPDRRLRSSLLGEIRSLQAIIRRLRWEIEISRCKEARSSHDARHDALTGLPNRVLLDSWLDHVLDASSGEVRCVAMFIDIDRFKPVNDCFGHQVGDRLLKAAALRIRDTVGKSALVARYAGDEFVVLLPGQGCLAARRLAERLVQAMCQPFDLDGLVVEIGASVGIAVAPPHGIEKQAFLRQADIALYAAKTYGGSNVQVFQRRFTDDARQA